MYLKNYQKYHALHVSCALARAQEVVRCNWLLAKFILCDKSFVVPCGLKAAYAVHDSSASHLMHQRSQRKGMGFQSTCMIVCDAQERRSGSIGANSIVGVGCFQAN